MPSTKRKRVTKRTKLSWRKHVHINDIEEFLEEKRADERLGEDFEFLPDQALFQIDTKPSTPSQIPKKGKKSLDTLPRCFRLLQPLTKVPDPISKRNRVRTKEERQSTIRMPSKVIERKEAIQKAKHILANRNRELSRANKEARTNKYGEFNHDAWNVEDIEPINAEIHNEWYSNDIIRHTYRGLSKKRKQTPKSLSEKQTILPTVEIPHPGMSYNPSFKDHQALLQEIAEKEYKIIKEEEHIQRVTKRMFSKVTESQKNSSWLVEMSEGLPTPGDKKEKDDGILKSINPPVRNQKKDRKQKRKQREQQELERARHIAKQEKRKISDIYRLRTIKKSIENRDEKNKILQEKREKIKEYKSLEPKRLGTNKFETPDLEFKMGTDITGNLRNLKAEGNLLRDRFVSMQKRNILEPTMKRPPNKRAKVKRFEKSGHKMGWEPKGY